MSECVSAMNSLTMWAWVINWVAWTYNFCSCHGLSCGCGSTGLSILDWWLINQSISVTSNIVCRILIVIKALITRTCRTMRIAWSLIVCSIWDWIRVFGGTGSVVHQSFRYYLPPPSCVRVLFVFIFKRWEILSKPSKNSMQSAYE